jgi:hypothetical protein
MAGVMAILSVGLTESEHFSASKQAFHFVRLLAMFVVVKNVLAAQGTIQNLRVKIRFSQLLKVNINSKMEVVRNKICTQSSQF